jgi:hypothetical protein
MVGTADGPVTGGDVRIMLKHTLQKGPIVDRVRAYLESSEYDPVPIVATGITQLSRKSVAVRDTSGETDVYFVLRSYKIAHPGVWKDSRGDNTLVPPALRGTGLGVLQGTACYPQIRDSESALGIAKSELIPLTKEAKWFTRLKRIQ